MLEAVRATDLAAGLGHMVALSARSARHRTFTMDDAMRLFLPPLRLGQALFYRQGEAIVGFVTWAWLSDEVAEGFANRTRRLMQADWRSGDALWFVDFIAPHGHAKAIVGHLTTSVFPNHTGRASRVRPGGMRAVATYRGARP